MNHCNKQIDVIIVDFAKAFEKLPYMKLLYKLDYYEIRGSIIVRSAHDSLNAVVISF